MSRLMCTVYSRPVLIQECCYTFNVVRGRHLYPSRGWQGSTHALTDTDVLLYVRTLRQEGYWSLPPISVDYA